jgi:type VI protein secretion system component Hcp
VNVPPSKCALKYVKRQLMNVSKLLTVTVKNENSAHEEIKSNETASLRFETVNVKYTTYL